MINWYLIYAYALGMSFALSFGLTHVARRLAVRFGVYDHPGERKMQLEPMPLLGGVAIVLSFHAMILFHFLMLEPVRRLGFAWLEAEVLSFLGADVRLKLLGLSTGGLLIFALGFVDDLRSLGPEIKLGVQVIATAIVVWSGIRLDLFIPNPWVSAGVTMVWIMAIMNAMNFLDNMDGLCGGVSIIAAFAFFLCMLPHDDLFVCVLLMVFAGAVGGFLYHNLYPARIYMGDAGALFCGYVLATVAVLGTFYTVSTPSRVAVAAPVVALGVPIFDILSVVYIRWRSGESIMRGDKRHFSHRLVQLGMSPPQAVEFIYLVGSVVGLGAVLLPHVSLLGTVIILAQTIGVFCLIALLMHATNNRRGHGS